MSILVPATALQNQLSASGLGKVTEDGTCVQVLVIHVGDPGEAPSPWFQPGQN